MKWLPKKEHSRIKFFFIWKAIKITRLFEDVVICLNVGTQILLRDQSIDQMSGAPMSISQQSLMGIDWEVFKLR